MPIEMYTLNKSNCYYDNRLKIHLLKLIINLLMSFKCLIILKLNISILMKE